MIFKSSVNTNLTSIVPLRLPVTIKESVTRMSKSCESIYHIPNKTKRVIQNNKAAEPLPLILLIFIFPKIQTHTIFLPKQILITSWLFLSLEWTLMSPQIFGFQIQALSFCPFQQLCHSILVFLLLPDAQVHDI